MAETPDGQEKTEPASGKRLNEARNQGQVSKSMDVTTAAVLLFGSMAIFLFGKNLIGNLQGFMKSTFYNSSVTELTFASTQKLFLSFVSFLGSNLLPIMASIYVIIFAAEISQVGFKIATQKFTKGLRFKQIFNPFSGIKKIFLSGRSAFELVKSLFKVGLLGAVAWWVLSGRQEEAIGLIERPFSEIAAFISSVSFELIYKVAGFYVLIAFADYLYQKYRFREDMKMTKQEVKEEYKQAEGDPKIKGRIRSLMRQRIRKLMLSNVKQADVVITNPTHIAVAMQYKPGTMSAPTVLAKGVDFLAMQIREIAKEHNVPIIEEPPLARTLYYSVEVGREIPEKLFKAVAQILAYVYRIKNRKV